MKLTSGLCVASIAFVLASCQSDDDLSIGALAANQAGTQTVPGLTKKNVIIDPQARKVVDEMYAAYATCKTYTDTGTYVAEDTRMTFKTRFRRPDRLYFEFTAKDNARDGRFVYWTTGVRKKMFHSGVDGPGYWDDTVLTNAWYGDGGAFEKDQSLGMTVAGFTGISMGTGANVPNMIFVSEIGSLSLSDMDDLVLEAPVDDRGVKCDVVYSKEHMTRAWIDKKTHLLRRMSEKFDPSDQEMITEYIPMINGEVKDEQLTFKPPR